MVQKERARRSRPRTPPRPTLGDEILLKLLQELQVEQVLGGERLLSHHRFHSLHVLPDGVTGVLWKGSGQRGAEIPSLETSFAWTGTSCPGGAQNFSF